MNEAETRAEQIDQKLKVSVGYRGRHKNPAGI